MKLNRNIFIFALILILLFFCISSVSAENSLNTTSEIQSIASDGSGDILRDLGTTIHVDSSYSGENENGSADAPYKKISSAVGSANGGENIFIKNGEYSESAKISPAVSMNFVGESQNGVIIKSNSTDSLFEMLESGIVLSFNNLTFKDVACNVNAPIKIGGNSDVNINNCSFINCSSKSGSIHLYTKATATVSNCKIENSKCTKSGGCGALYISAGTFNIKNTLINNSRFKVNSGFMYGVIYSYDSNAIVNLDNVTISNSKGVASGVIYNKGTINVKNSKIISNTVEKSSTGLQGESVIYTHNGAKTTIEQSVIADNVAPNNFIYNIGATSNTVLNYNAIYNNTFGRDFASSNGITNLDYNWWGSNSQPTGVTVNNWVIVDEDNHQMLNDGSPLDKELPIPTLNNPEPNDDAIYVSMSGNDNNNGSRDAPLATIAKAIEIANAGKIIILNGQYTITNTLKVNKTLSIEGKGNVVIDGNSLRILENTDNLNLTNIKFTNAKSAFASAILNEGNMTINTCSFYSNKATGTSNGNIINNKANLTINNCDFHENIASRGAIASQSKSKLLINNSKFHNNDMTSIITTYGIIYSNSADVVVVNTNFTDNKAKSGGAIYVTRASSSTTGTLNVLNCIFKNNIANIGNGGAIFTARTLTNIENSTFINNTAIKSFNNVGGDGGAIYQSIDDLKNIVTIKNSIFIGNAAFNGAAFYVNAGKLNVSNSIILNKENDNTYALNKSNGVSNSAITANDNWWGSNSKANALIPVERWVMMDASYSPSNAQPGDEITIEASFTKYNSTSGTGDLAGIIPDGIIVKFKTNTMGLNKNATTKNGKAIVTYTLTNEDNNIYVSSSNANVTLPIILEILDIIYVSPNGNDSNNGARETPVASLAHAIEIAERGQIVLLEGTHSASGLSISNTLNITGEGSAIIDVGANGRLAYIHVGGVLTLNNLTLINGYLSSESGALLGNAGNLTLINTTLSNSTSTNNGGAIYNVGNLKIINSIIANNKAELGGAIFADAFAGKGSLVIINTTFTNNTAKGNNRDKAGGAIYAQAFKGKFDILNSTFIANTAGSYGGGAIFGLQLGDVSIKNSTFVNNTAKSTENYGGGAICFIGGNYQKEGSLTIKNTLFDNNKANVSGAAIYVRGSTLTISNSVLLNNIDNNGIAIHKGVTSYVSAVVNANDNWWGTNKNPSRFVSFGSNLNRWVILTATNNTAITEGNTVRLTVSLNTYTTGTINGTLDSPIIISRPVVINTTSGVINGILENGEFSTDYIVPSGLKIIIATVDDETQVIYVKVVKTELTINNITAKKGDRIDFIANVVANDGEIINRGHVDLYINNILVKVIPVSNGKAIERILISNDVGVYDILAKYIDETGGFDKSNASAILNVTGINNIVTNSTFFNFFDSDGVLLADVPFTDLIFLGDFSGLGVNIITLDKTVSIVGHDAVLKDMGYLIMAPGVVLNNLTLSSAVNNFADNGGAVILVVSENVELSNLDILCNMDNSADIFVVVANDANGLILKNNKISFTILANGGKISTPVKIDNSNNTIIKNNNIIVSVPSYDIEWSLDPVTYEYAPKAKSEGFLIKKSRGVKFEDNNILINVNNKTGNFNTMYGLHTIGCDDLEVSDNKIEVNGSKYAYAAIISGQDINIENNNIYAHTDDYYAAAIDIEGPAKAKIDSNNLTAKSSHVVYVIYSGGFMGRIEAEYTNNNLTGESRFVFGTSLTGVIEDFINNTVILNGSYTMGVTGDAKYLQIINNTITANGTNIGSSDGSGDTVISNVESAGVIIVKQLGNANVTNNKIKSTGNYTVITEREGNVINNYLIANELFGDDSVKATNTNTTIKNNAPFKTGLIIKVEDIAYGQTFTIMANLTHKINGEVIVTIKNKNYTINIVNGSGSLVADDILPVGIYTVSAKYNGNQIHLPATNITTFIIVKSIVNIKVNANNIIYGEDLTISHILNVSDADGRVLYFIDGGIVGDSAVGSSINVSNLKAGTYAVVVKLVDDSNYMNAVSDSLAVNVAKTSNVDITISIAPLNPSYGDKVKVNIIVPEDADGKILIVLDNKTTIIKAPGESYTFAPTSAGEHTISVSLVNDTNYMNTTKNTKFNVAKKNTMFMASALMKYYLNNTHLFVTLKDSAGKLLVNKKVTIKINTVTYNLKTDSKGIAKLLIRLNPKSYVAEIKFAGDNNYNAANKKVNVKVVTPKIKAVKAKVKRNKYLQVSFKTYNNKAIKNTKVVLKIKGKTYIAKTNNKGIAKLKLKLKKGTYKVKTSFKFPAKYGKTTKTLKIKVI